MTGSNRRFPPPLGWIPVGVGLLAVILLSIWGIGEQKQRIFGAEILELIASNSA